MASDKEKNKNAVVNYLQSSAEELRKVTWPTKNRAIRMTFLVLGFCLAVAIVLGILDFVFGIGYRSLLDLGPERTLPVTVTEETADTGVIEGDAVTVGDETTATAGDVPVVEVNLGEETTGTDGVTVTTDAVPAEPVNE